MSTGNSTPVISAESLSVVLNNKPILTDLNFEVMSGEVFALLDGNGACKSTTLRTFLGMNSPTSGAAKVLGAVDLSRLIFVRNKSVLIAANAMQLSHSKSLSFNKE